jgi:hypothetical protein
MEHKGQKRWLLLISACFGFGLGIISELLDFVIIWPFISLFLIYFFFLFIILSIIVIMIYTPESRQHHSISTNYSIKSKKRNLSNYWDYTCPNCGGHQGENYLECTFCKDVHILQLTKEGKEPKNIEPLHLKKKKKY